MTEIRFITKIFSADADDSADAIDEWLNDATAQFSYVEIVGYATTINGICITLEIRYNDEDPI